jgi:hypothetical protein
MSERKFEKVGNGLASEKWDPRATESNGFHFKAGDDANNVLEGYYVEAAELEGKANADGKKSSFTVHKIHEVLKDGSMGKVWGTSGGKVLDESMEKITIGSYVRVEYTGKRRKKDVPPANHISQTNSYHTWNVGVDKNAIPYNQLPGSKGIDASVAKNASASTPASAPDNTVASTQSFSSRGAGAQSAVDSNGSVDFKGDDLPW